MERKVLDARKHRELRRKENTRKQGIRRLIVTEGEKTEIYYFEEIRQRYRLSTTTISVIHSYKGTGPEKVVASAIELFLYGNHVSYESQCIKVEAKSYDEVYIVFDRDEHYHYKAALDQISYNNKKHKNDDKKAVPFIAIPSNPCFEYWLLLHFNNCRVLKHRDDISLLLKKNFPEYDKASKTNFQQTKHKLKEAMQCAESINKDSSPISTESPYTGIPILLRALMTSKELE